VPERNVSQVKVQRIRKIDLLIFFLYNISIIACDFGTILLKCAPSKALSNLMLSPSYLPDDSLHVTRQNTDVVRKLNLPS
jgi:hypothetical protein